MTVSGYCQLNLRAKHNFHIQRYAFLQFFYFHFIFFLFFVNSKGKVRLQRLERPPVIKISAPLTTVTPKHKTEKTPSPLMPTLTTGEYQLTVALFHKIHRTLV
jgi:hypothetical protein